MGWPWQKQRSICFCLDLLVPFGAMPKGTINKALRSNLTVFPTDVGYPLSLFVLTQKGRKKSRTAQRSAARPCQRTATVIWIQSCWAIVRSWQVYHFRTETRNRVMRGSGRRWNWWKEQRVGECVHFGPPMRRYTSP